MKWTIKKFGEFSIGDKDKRLQWKGSSKVPNLIKYIEKKEMARLKELGHEPAYQVQAVKYKYLKPLVESLEVQLNGEKSVG